MSDKRGNTSDKTGGEKKRKQDNDKDGEGSDYKASSSIQLRRSQRIKAKNESSSLVVNLSPKIKANNEGSEDSVLRRVINLPQELINLIVKHFSVTDLKTFRLLCLQYKDLDKLQFAVIKEMKKRCVLHIDLRRWNDDYVPHLDIVRNSPLKFRLYVDLPKYQDQANWLGEKSNLLSLTDECHDRISQCKFWFYTHGSESYSLFNTPLLKLTKLEKLTYGPWTKSKELSLAATEVVNNNSATLEYLGLRSTNIPDFIFKDFPNLKKIWLNSCAGSMGLQSLFQSATNVEFLELNHITLPDDFQFIDLPKLTTIELFRCKGSTGFQSLFLSAANLNFLTLKFMTLPNFQNTHLMKLKKIELISCVGDIGLQSLFLSALNLEYLHLENITLSDDVQLNDLTKLTTIELWYCKCTSGLKTLLCRATNLKVLKLYEVYLDTDTAAMVDSNHVLDVQIYYL